jgi:hypothetical protein
MADVLPWCNQDRESLRHKCVKHEWTTCYDTLGSFCRKCGVVRK